MAALLKEGRTPETALPAAANYNDLFNAYSVNINT
jgi:hypothetical protein